MNIELKNHWKSLLQPVFQDGTDFDVVDPDASYFRAEVRWKVGTDPDRPNKMSKPFLSLCPMKQRTIMQIRTMLGDSQTTTNYWNLSSQI